MAPVGNGINSDPVGMMTFFAFKLLSYTKIASKIVFGDAKEVVPSPFKLNIG
jgi:hypothetical protein